MAWLQYLCISPASVGVKLQVNDNLAARLAMKQQQIHPIPILVDAWTALPLNDSGNVPHRGVKPVSRRGTSSASDSVRRVGTARQAWPAPFWAYGSPARRAVPLNRIEHDATVRPVLHRREIPPVASNTELGHIRDASLVCSRTAGLAHRSRHEKHPKGRMGVQLLGCRSSRPALAWSAFTAACA